MLSITVVALFVEYSSFIVLYWFVSETLSASEPDR